MQAVVPAGIRRRFDMIGRFEENTIYNENFYKAIKEIPDKSIDCVYIDIPYKYTTGGGYQLPSAKDLRNESVNF